MDKTFWGLYNAQIEALKECSSPEEANMVMLETAKLLVEHIDVSAETISQYDRFGVRKLFAAHNALGNAVVSFYESEKEILDPAAQAGNIGQRIESLSEKIVSTDADLQKLQELEKSLLDKEKELAALEKELEKWKAKVSHLRDIETNAAAEIEKYKEQFALLDKTVSCYAEEIAFWEAHLGENSEIVRCMSVYGVPSLQALLTSIEKLKTNVRYDLDAFDTVIRKIVNAEEAARDSILRKQNKMV